MSDPFSVTGSAVGVVSLGLTLCQGFRAYYGPWKAYDTEIQEFTSKVDGVQTTLQVLEKLIAEARELNLSFEAYKKLVSTNLTVCQQGCRKLEEMLEKCKGSNTSTEDAKRFDRLQLTRARYPFKKATLVSLSQAVSGFQDNLSVALQILHMAVIHHQHKQLQELTLRSSSIDARTTEILSTVENQPGAIVPLMKDMLEQELLIVKRGYRPMLEPDSLKELIGRQVASNKRLGLPHSALRCTCSRTQWGSKSTISLLALFLHETTCPLYKDGQKLTSIGAKYTFCTRFIGFSLQVMMTIKRGAGGFSIGTSLDVRCVVADDSPAFKLLDNLKGKMEKDNRTIYLEDARRTLAQMFHASQASPTDMLSDGSTLLHKFSAVLDDDMDSSSLTIARGLIKDLIRFRVPLQERDIRGRTALDQLIWKRLVHQRLKNIWSAGETHIPDELFAIYSDLLTSGSFLTTPAQVYGIIESDRQADVFFDFNVIRRLMVENVYEEYMLSNAEIAVHMRSEEGLMDYISGPPQKDLDMVIFMCLGWPQGMKLILNSPLRLYIKSLEGAFVHACKAHDAECAVLLLEATESLTKRHIEHAGLSDQPDILDALVSKLVAQRRELQTLALKKLPSQKTDQLGLPRESLLDLDTVKVYNELKHKPDFIDPKMIKSPYSVYSSIWYNLNAANRLFEAGFTDLNQSDESGRTALMLLHITGLNPDMNFVDTLNFAQWMVSKGASLYQKNRVGYPTIYYLAESVGSDMGMKCIFLNPSINRVLGIRAAFWYQMRNFELGCVEFLHSILLDDTQDSCCCACSVGGCQAFTRLLKRFYHCVNRRDVRAMIPGILRCFQVVLSWGSFGDSNTKLAERAIRYVTFDKLDLTHTCHVKDTPLDEEEVQEIREEESQTLATLEKLVDEFNVKYRELGLHIDEFLDGYWTDRMNEVLSVSSEIDPDILQQIRELGVVISSPRLNGDFDEHDG